VSAIMSMSNAQFYLHIDDVLGPASKRFFGDGYRRVRQRLMDIRIDMDEPGRVRLSGAAEIGYPADWSVKEEFSELRPHLSTLDAAVIAIELGEYYLAYWLRLCTDQRERAWLRSFEIKAGSKPQLDLSDVTAEAVVTAGEPVPSVAGTWISSVQGRVGSLKFMFEIVHEPGTPREECWSSEGDCQLLGDHGARYYTEGFKRSGRDIEAISVRPEIGSVNALVTIREPGTACAGLGAAYRPTLSMIDTLMTIAPMTQALLYNLDHVERKASSTLWMRRVQCAAARPSQPISDPFTATVSITKSRITEMQGMRWRSADMSYQILGMEGSLSVAHGLPTM